MNDSKGLLSNYSRIYQKFLESLNQPDALTNPEKYLGPNYQDVLNFWIYVDSLSYQERKEMQKRYFTIEYNLLSSANIATNTSTDNVIGYKFRHHAHRATFNITGRSVFSWATNELIAYHKLIEQNKTPLALNIVNYKSISLN